MGLHQKMQVVLLRGEKREIVSKYIPFITLPVNGSQLCVYIFVCVSVRMTIMSMSSDGC